LPVPVSEPFVVEIVTRVAVMWKLYGIGADPWGLKLPLSGDVRIRTQ
jgi:hypothetical protein